MVTRFIWISLTLAGTLGLASHALGQQQWHRAQPIILEAATQLCSSPAATASQPIALPCGDCTYLAPVDRDPLRVVPVASQLRPLPSVQTMRGYESPVTTVTEYPETVPALPGTATTVRVMRPAVVVPIAPTVPEGYVVGKGLVGQPKLYKPGQPVRNFLRYITL